MDRPKQIAFAAAAPSIASAQSAAPQNLDARRCCVSIVPQKPVDQNGSEVKLESSGAAVDPAGDGKATCPPVALAMAGPLTGADTRSAPMSGRRPAGRRSAQRRQPGLPSPVQALRYRG